MAILCISHIVVICYIKLYSNKGAVSISNPNYAPIVFFGPIVQGWITPDLSWGLAADALPGPMARGKWVGEPGELTGGDFNKAGTGERSQPRLA